MNNILAALLTGPPPEGKKRVLKMVVSVSLGNSDYEAGAILEKLVDDYPDVTTGAVVEYCLLMMMDKLSEVVAEHEDGIGLMDAINDPRARKYLDALWWVILLASDHTAHNILEENNGKASDLQAES